MDFEIPSGTSKGILTTIEGILDRAIDGLSQEQPIRKAMEDPNFDKIESVIESLKVLMEGKVEDGSGWDISVRDVAGNCWIENLEAPKLDPKLKITYFTRSQEQNESLGKVEKTLFHLSFPIHSAFRFHSGLCPTMFHVFSCSHF